MKKSTFQTGLLLFSALFLVLIGGCERDYPEAIYNPDASIGATPEILALDPPDATLAGVGKVIITGTHFSENPEENLVFFDGERAAVLSATETVLEVIAPNIFGETIKVKIAVKGAQMFSNVMIYRLDPAVNTVGTLFDGDKAHGIAISLTDDIFVSIEGKLIKKIDNNADVSVFANTSFLKSTNMKMGPANQLFASVAAGRVRRLIRFDEAGTENTYVSLSKNPYDFDFDASGNIWAGVGATINLIKPDQSKVEVLVAENNVIGLKIFNGFIYFITQNVDATESKLMKTEIQAETLGTAENILDLAAAAWMDNARVLCLTMSADGEIYLGTDGEIGVFIYNEQQTAYSILYNGLIAGPIVSMTWNQDHYIYAVHQIPDATSEVYKINMDVKAGAPYYGRK